jgi:hypothetical protein
MRSHVYSAAIFLSILPLLSCGSKDEPTEGRTVKYSDIGPAPAMPGFYGGDSRNLKVEVPEGPARQYIITNIDMVCEVTHVDSTIQAIQRRIANI